MSVMSELGEVILTIETPGNPYQEIPPSKVIIILN